jgi:hypothetical protein
MESFVHVGSADVKFGDQVPRLQHAFCNGGSRRYRTVETRSDLGGRYRGRECSWGGGGEFGEVAELEGWGEVDAPLFELVVKFGDDREKGERRCFGCVRLRNALYMALSPKNMGNTGKRGLYSKNTNYGGRESR